MAAEQQALIPEIIGSDDERKPNDGNGRPKGARARKHKLLEAIARNNSVALLETVIAAAMNGDMIAAKIVFDRIWPKPRTAPVAIPDMPATNSPADIRKAMHDMLARVTSGEITSDDGAAVVAMMRDILQAHSIQATGDTAIEGAAGDAREALFEKMRKAAEDARRREQEILDAAAAQASPEVVQ